MSAPRSHSRRLRLRGSVSCWKQRACPGRAPLPLPSWDVLEASEDGRGGGRLWAESRAQVTRSCFSQRLAAFGPGARGWS